MISPQRLRATMGRFPTGVTIVTAAGGAEPAALAANAVTSLSLEPALMLACLDRGARTLRAVERAGSFAINVLDDASEPLARSFGRGVPMAEKWEGVAWSEREQGPQLEAAIVWIGCELRDVLSGGDHVIVTGEVRAIAEREGAPLVFYEGGYRSL